MPARLHSSRSILTTTHSSDEIRNSPTSNHHPKAVRVGLMEVARVVVAKGAAQEVAKEVVAMEVAMEVAMVAAVMAAVMAAAMAARSSFR